VVTEISRWWSEAKTTGIHSPHDGAPERAREILATAPGLELVDEPARNRYPMPIDVAGKDNCQVGRVRRDCALENGLAFWISGDQLLKGAALNAVQIAELL